MVTCRPIKCSFASFTGCAHTTVDLYAGSKTHSFSVKQFYVIWCLCRTAGQVVFRLPRFYNEQDPPMNGQSHLFLAVLSVFKSFSFFSVFRFHAQWLRQDLARGAQNYLKLFVPRKWREIIHWTRFSIYFVEATAQSCCQTLCGYKVNWKNNLLEIEGARGLVPHNWRRQCPCGRLSWLRIDSFSSVCYVLFVVKFSFCFILPRDAAMLARSWES